MHTAVCTFRDRASAEQAREHLVRSGFQRHALHIGHGDSSDGTARTHAGEDPRGWEGTDHEVAVDRDVVDRVAGFFVRLFGRDHPEGHDRRYAEAVYQGRYVLVIDTMDEQEARRAHAVLNELGQPEDATVVHRPAQRPLRDIVGAQEDGGWAGSYADRASAFDDAHAQAPEAGAATPRRGEWTQAAGDRHEAARDRAIAAGEMGEPRPADLRDPDLDHVGLRYADKDKPAR